MNKQEIEKAIETITIIHEHIDLECDLNEDLTRYYSTIISALQQQLTNGWISVSERLPNTEECNLYHKMHPCHRQFICTIKIKGTLQTRQLFFSKVFGWMYGPDDYNQHVIAWRSLPEPYKEVSNE